MECAGASVQAVLVKEHIINFSEINTVSCTSGVTLIIVDKELCNIDVRVVDWHNSLGKTDYVLAIGSQISVLDGFNGICEVSFMVPINGLLGCIFVSSF